MGHMRKLTFLGPVLVAAAWLFACGSDNNTNYGPGLSLSGHQPSGGTGGGTGAGGGGGGGAAGGGGSAAGGGGGGGAGGGGGGGGGSQAGGGGGGAGGGGGGGAGGGGGGGGAAVTFTHIYTAYIGPGSAGHCGDTNCHQASAFSFGPCDSQADCYSAIALYTSNWSAKSNFTGTAMSNMPQNGTPLAQNSQAVSDINSWINASATPSSQ
jgi:hypothetical protein